MNCKQCGKKIGILNRIKVGEDYLCKDCHKKVREESNQWNRAGRKKVSDEWIRKTLEEIALLDPNREIVPGLGIDGLPHAQPAGAAHAQSAGASHAQSADIPLAQMSYSLSDAMAVSEEFSKFSGAQTSKTFQQMLLGLIKDRGMTNPEFYNAAMIDRKLFSTIKNNANYKPKKETAVACCFGLNLSLKEAEKLLEAAGYKLSLAILWDRIIYFCLDHRITDLDIVNELLYEEKQKCIGVIE